MNKKQFTVTWVIGIWIVSTLTQRYFMMPTALKNSSLLHKYWTNGLLLCGVYLVIGGILVYALNDKKK